MFLRRNIPECLYDRLADKIRKDLAETLQKKGICISKVKVELKTDKINMSMCFREQ